MLLVQIELIPHVVVASSENINNNDVKIYKLPFLRNDDKTTFYKTSLVVTELYQDPQHLIIPITMIFLYLTFK